jgi:hypothetical protein
MVVKKCLEFKKTYLERFCLVLFPTNLTLQTAVQFYVDGYYQLYSYLPADTRLVMILYVDINLTCLLVTLVILSV